MANALEMFTTLFQGNSSCYGIHLPDESDTAEGVKRKGKSFTKQANIEPEHYAAHIAGEMSIGVVPITQDSKVHFMALDIDVYPMNPVRYSTLFFKFGIPMVCFRSKSGGLHAYCFFNKPVPADEALDQLNSIRQLLGLDKATELFPKQRKLAMNSKGNWINLPYFGGDVTERYAYNADGNPMKFAAAMEYCMSMRTTLRLLKDTLRHLPFAPAPPCIQTLYINGEVTERAHNRNIFMFNVGCYLKSRYGDDFEGKLQLVNNSLPQPMSQVELDKTVILSHKKGNYSYQCENPILSMYCDKQICAKREYGKGSDTISDLSFESLVQVKATPPYYKWTINGVEMTFYSEDELRKQDKFMDYCIRHLHRCPNRLKEAVWLGILNRALQSVQVENVNEEEEVSEDTLFFSYFREFIVSRAFAVNLSQVKMGKVYRDDYRKVYVFRVEDLVEFLEGTKRFKFGTYNRLYNRLKLCKAKAAKMYDSQERAAFRAWLLPLDTFGKDLTDEASSVIAADQTSNAVTEQPAEAMTERQLVQRSASYANTADKLLAAMQRVQESDDSIPASELVDFSKYKEDEKF